VAKAELSYSDAKGSIYAIRKYISIFCRYLVLLCHVRITSVRPEPVEGYVWFDKLTTNGLEILAIVKHDKVKLVVLTEGWPLLA
jgi:hypothetical protein